MVSLSLSTVSTETMHKGMAELEERVNTLLTAVEVEQDDAGDTFAERAEWYYQKRPQLLGLLRDLYNAYLNLLDRHRQTTANRLYPDGQLDDDAADAANSDAESTLSYQHLPTFETESNIGDLVAQLVLKTVENEILVAQVREMEIERPRIRESSSEKLLVLKKLVEVVELEREIVEKENVKLGYRVTALFEENRGLVSELAVVKRKAVELARCLIAMREDRGVCALIKKIEHLEAQIHGIEKRSQEFYQLLLLKSYHPRLISNNSGNMRMAGCFQMKKKKKKVSSSSASSSSWWKKLKDMDMFTCGLRP